jgi:beta-galactosidase
MKMFKTLAITVFVLLFASAALAADSHKFEVGPDAFLLDGKPIQLISGEMHYGRIPPEYWEQRLQMARAMGLNAVTIYCFWNVHEPEPGQWNFTGFGDVARFCKLAQQQGLYVIVRPGPYVCAEWDFGGYPAWLLRTPTMKVRSMDPDYIKAADSYVQHMAEQLAPLQIEKGGPIILWQVENEYGSYGKDKEYLAHLRDAWKNAGIEVPLFTADGGGRMMANGSIDGALPGLNGGGVDNIFKEVGKYRPTGPFIVPEFYPGWLDHWGERHSTQSAQGAANGLKKLLDKNVSVNLYMFHGGTNWNGMSGANFGGHYQPQPTSYDYDAPLDEAGRPTKKYMLMRKVITDHIAACGGDAASIPPVPVPNPVVAIAPIELHESVSLLADLPKPVLSEKPLTMEEMNQNYGFVLYRQQIANSAGPHKLKIHGLADYAQVFVDQLPVAVMDRRLKQDSAQITLPAGETPQLDILVADDGRVNYGGQILNNHKGITDHVSLGDQTLTGWQNYSLPLPDVEKLKFTRGSTEPPAYFHGAFELTEIGDTYLDMRGWTKGWVWVNGHNLGRYWFIGPQQTLYMPGCWLHKGQNSIVVLEQEKLPEKLVVTGLTEPILDQVVKPKAVIARITRWKQAPALPDDALATRGDFADGAQPQTARFDAPKTGRYLCLQALSSQKGDPFANAAEIGALDAAGKPLPRDKWAIAYADSEENISEDGNADNVLDGDGETLWHTQYDGGQPNYPHLIVIDLGEVKTVSALVYTPRPTDSPGRIKGYKVYVLTDAP